MGKSLLTFLRARSGQWLKLSAQYFGRCNDPSWIEQYCRGSRRALRTFWHTEIFQNAWLRFATLRAMDTKHLSPLVSALDAGYQYRPHEMLGYFLSATMSLWGLPEWMPIPEDARPKISTAIEAYADIVAQQPPFMDVLGPLYMDLASRGGRAQLGQYFTPWPISQAMAKMISGDSLPDSGPLYRACDPASGSGVMLLAFANEILEQHGTTGLLRLSITACDLDPYCARMCATQIIANCNIHNVQLGEVLIYCGNSLGPWHNLDVVVHASAPTVAKEPPALAPERLAALSAAAQSHPDVMQLELFADAA